VPIAAVVAVVATTLGSLRDRAAGGESPLPDWPKPTPITTPTPFPDEEARQAWHDGYGVGYEDGYDDGMHEPGTTEEPVYPYDDWP